MPGGTKKYSPIFLAVFAVFLIATMICVAGTLIGVLSAEPSHHDTQWFWASGKLLVHGQNPYDREAVRGNERSLGLVVMGKDVPMPRNPPSTLFLMTLIGFLGPREAVIGWSLLLAFFFAVSVLAIRDMADAPFERGYVLLMWCFAPALSCIEVGQTGLIMLVGLALFLRFHESRPLWAGAALSLCVAKPHLLLPFGVVVLAWIVAQRKWVILSGVLAALAIESLFPMALYASVWPHYFAAMRTERVLDEFIPTFGTALRFLVNRNALWLEFVPAALGCVWAGWYFWRNRKQWDWRTHGSVVTLVSLVVTPYSFFTDQVLAIPAILFALMSAGGPRRGSVTLLMTIMIAAAADMIASPSLFFKPDMILGLVWLGWYLYATSGAVRMKEAVVAG